ncbi:Non-specific serine/threonine protein kinase protein [Dioscorea alata]|uniref:Non-specific serine/threonine protein kinase protein n=1 Tax=Dioscorea alata TaxID=55571 RepID=A0ACB7WJH8_DIOAL|nr:Non-specific serine/threonine protein kinase protein [Dioscorea alata]
MAADDEPKKVKILCSCGGRILPRPSDGALRYVGGDTRIVSVRRDVSFSELSRKILDSFGGPLVLKYQLPDQDLDALVSVSCPEDLDNMMEEYDKLVDASPDGSSKLRAFLFSPSETDGNPLEAGDSGHRYIDAVNGIGRRDSVASVTSATSATSGASHNSDTAFAATDCATNEGNSPTLDSKLSYQESASIHYGHPQPLSELAGAPAQSFVPVRPLQPLSQLPPLPPSYLKPAMPVPVAQGQTVRLDDCYMCQRALPHAHSDNLIQEKGNASSSSSLGNSFAEVNPVFFSHHSEDMMRQHRAAVGDNVVDARAENAVLGGHLGVYGVAPMSEAEYGGGGREVFQKMENLEHARGLAPASVMGLAPASMMGFPGDISYGMVAGNVPPWMHIEDFQQQQQQQQLRGQTLVPPPLYPVKQDVVSRPLGVDVSSTRNANFLPAESPNLNPFPEGSNEYVRPVDGMMGSLRLGPSDAGRYDEQGKPVVRPNYGVSKDVKPDTSLMAENSHIYGVQVGGPGIQVSNAVANHGVLEKNGVIPTNLLPPLSYGVPYLQSLQTSEIGSASMVVNQIPDSHNLEPGHEPPIPSERLLGVPTYASAIDSTYNSHAINHKIAVGDQRGETSGVHMQNPADQMPSPLDGNMSSTLVSAGNPASHVEYLQEPLSSDSLFSNHDPWNVAGLNHDPWNVAGVTHQLPPRTIRVGGKEPVAARDLCMENFAGNTTDSNIVSLLEEGALHHPLDPVAKEPHQHVQYTTVEDQIKQDLQAIAEGVAASVLRTSAPIQSSLNPAHNPESADFLSAVAMVDQKVEETRAKQLDKVNTGIQITEDIGRLQIIKSIDLEELKELGSGTFGTVYHGKWRGSDVAIKRINDRCFSGKPSEQERMRADFWNEASKLADLHHPNVLAFYGVVLDGPGGSVATVTEYMVNGSLKQALQKNDKTLDFRKRLLIAMDVAFGMEYLHGKNIVHFDLKSDNLLVNLRDPQRPICKVGDLGLSKVKCQTLISGGVRGTLPWMAPELLNGSSSLVSEKVDVFSFGIVMWELLTGEEPYADLHYGAIIGGIVSNTLRPPIPENCDPDWRLLMEQCWSAEPSERPSFTEIAGRLRAMAASFPLKGQAQPHPPPVQSLIQK